MHPERTKHPGAKRPKSRHKDTDKLLQAAWDAGWWLYRTKGDTYVHCLSPDGVHRTKAANTPSDHRGLRNLRTALRHGGLDV